MPQQPLPDQMELRRRLRAARILVDLSITELAERIPAEAEMGERVIRKLENGETKLKPQNLRVLAHAMNFPYAWFTEPSVAAAFQDDAVDRRYEAFEREFTTRLDALRSELGLPPGDATSGSGTRPSQGRRSPRAIRPGSTRQ